MARRVEDVLEMMITRLERLAVPGERDALGRTRAEARRDINDFMHNCPKFERGKGRWVDFARRFTHSKNYSGVTDEQAKDALYYQAITGPSSRLVIASMAPDQAAYVNMTFAQYLERMGEKFTPAAESVQMEAEYKARRQGKNEDVQNYINAKYELFQLAYPNAPERAVAEFYKETTEGFLNRYVRDQMFSYEPQSIEAFGARAVNIVQVERRRIRIGDSETKSMDGLIPVTKKIKDPDDENAVEPMEVDHLHNRAGVAAEDRDDELCECMALHENGLKGPCYYCYKKGHIARSCPRKAAGLPKARNPAYDGQKNGYKPNPYSKPAATYEKSKGNGKNQNQSQKKFIRSGNRVYQLVEDEDEDPEEGEDETAEEEEPSAHFLEDLTL